LAKRRTKLGKLTDELSEELTRKERQLDAMRASLEPLEQEIARIQHALDTLIEAPSPQRIKRMMKKEAATV